ncbi:11074_t:CDS:2 [Paraglomus brasilianum]|uniref:11074_t:CDS:1 n=1 Tax=Paraglomus brasilianum TaxID=144538 RepID=A0A9N9F3U0_9GLOM|nr:11074_t:CDS:2 [Paraglomus brasilianum]
MARYDFILIKFSHSIIKIKYLRVPDEIIEMVREDAARRQASGGNRGGRGQRGSGRGGGRGSSSRGGRGGMRGGGDRSRRS